MSDKRFSKCEFINTFNTADIATWVLFNKLDEFCEARGYKEWKKEQQEFLRQQQFYDLEHEL